MIENIEQAKKHLKGIIYFYKLNDENNYDYTDKDLISIRIVLEEIERLTKVEQEHQRINGELREENKRLNNIIEEYKNANEYHQNIIHELETMKQPNQLHSENVKLRAENNRLNNIINELEKWLFDNKNCVPKHITDYFEKLKGEDKE